MDDFHDDDAHHDNKDEDDQDSHGDDGHGSRTLVPVSQAPVPSLTFRIGAADSTPGDVWIARVIEDLPEGFCFDERRDLIIDGETDWAICGPLRVAARLSDVTGTAWHLVLEFRDPEGNIQEVIHSAGTLAASAKEIACSLANGGLVLCGTAAALGRFIRAARPQAIGTVLMQPGHARLRDGTPVYADRTGAVLRHPTAAGQLIRTVGLSDKTGKAGSLQSWQNEVAALAMGNPILIVALAAAFAGPLLSFAKAAPIGLNFYGATSSGKSTALRVMASVYDDPTTLQTWNATRTAIELMAREANDSLMILDEFPSRPERWHVETLMTLGNGVGRSRSDLSLSLKRAVGIRTVLASAAEKSVRQFLREAGISPPDGMAVRMIDIPVRRWTHGLFEDLHGHSDARMFSMALCDAAARNHGLAGTAFISSLLLHDAFLRKKLGPSITSSYNSLVGQLQLAEVPAEVGRVLHAFALINIAAILAIHVGILPWQKEAVREAIVDVARVWLADWNGEVSQRSRLIAERIHADHNSFIEFGAPGGSPETDTGWRTPDWYHVLPAAFDRYAGAQPQNAARDLEADGILRRGTEANCLLSRITVPGLRARKRVYCLRRAAILDALGLAGD